MSTYADAIAAVRRDADQARALNEVWLRNYVDQLRVDLGLAEVVYVGDREPIRTLRRSSVGQTRALLDPAVRILHCGRACAPYAHVHFIKDKTLPGRSNA